MIINSQDNGTIIQVTVQKDGALMDLTAATVRLNLSDGTSYPMVVQAPATAGVVTHTVVAGEFNPGVHLASLQVVIGTFIMNTKPFEFIVKGAFA